MDVFDRRAFRAWLEQRRGQYVGDAVNGYSCPLALWLSERCGMPYMVGMYEAASLESPVQSLLLPAWARTFVRMLDACYPSTWVAGEQALAVLDEVDEVVR